MDFQVCEEFFSRVLLAVSYDLWMEFKMNFDLKKKEEENQE
jgi:plasmid maintenance system antidote protein VapI